MGIFLVTIYYEDSELTVTDKVQEVLNICLFFRLDLILQINLSLYTDVECKKQATPTNEEACFLYFLYLIASKEVFERLNCCISI